MISKSCHWCICVKSTLMSRSLVCKRISLKEQTDLIPRFSQSLSDYLQYMSVYCQGEYLHYPLLCCLKVHNHEVAVMYLPWTAELCWPLARSFENEELRTSSWFTAERCCSGHATERTNERTIWTILPAELTDRNWTSTSSDEIQLCFIVVLPDYRRFCGAVKMKRNVSFCKTFSASSVSDVTISDSKRKEFEF